MTYWIQTKPSARKALDRIPKDARKRIAARIDALAENPRPHGIEKLTAPVDLYRIRVGAYRVIYTIHDDVLIVVVVKIAPRGEAYRDLLSR
jgi:mRNA interferase RelE/StbE